MSGGDTLHLAREQIALRALAALEVRGRSRRAGFFYGATALGAVGFVGALVQPASGEINAGELAVSVIGNFLIGGLIGQAIGAPSWVRVPLPR